MDDRRVVTVTPDKSPLDTKSLRYAPILNKEQNLLGQL